MGLKYYLIPTNYHLNPSGKMTDEGIIKVVKGAMEMLSKNDIYLLKNDLSERCITYKIAHYLQMDLGQFDIDSEYNGDINGPNGKKVIHFLEPEMKHYNILDVDYNYDLFGIDETYIRHVIPDIIIHKRGSNNNICAIEIKKTSNKQPYEYDYIKLRAYTTDFLGNHLNYQLGIFIEMSISSPGKFTYKFFQDGQEIEKPH